MSESQLAAHEIESNAAARLACSLLVKHGIELRGAIKTPLSEKRDIRYAKVLNITFTGTRTCAQCYLEILARARWLPEYGKYYHLKCWAKVRGRAKR